MIEQYGWTVVAVIIALVGLYATITNLKDKNHKPIDDLKENVASIDKTIIQLISTLNNLNDNYKENISKNEVIHADLVESIKHCTEKLTEHEIRIINAENKIDNINQKIDNITK